jgi:hypothetical protein
VDLELVLELAVEIVLEEGQRLGDGGCVGFALLAFLLSADASLGGGGRVVKVRRGRTKLWRIDEMEGGKVNFSSHTVPVLTPSAGSVPKFVAQKPDSVKIRSKFTADRNSFPE